MTAPGPQNSGGNALAGQVVTSTDYAVIGADMQAAGMTSDQISELLGLIGRTAELKHVQASREVVMAILPKLLQVMQDVHRSACLRIMARIQSKTGGLGVVVHNDCARIAYEVSLQPPSQQIPVIDATSALQPRVRR